MIGRLSWSGMGYFHFCSSFSVLMSVTLPRLTKHRPIPAAHILLLGIGNKLLFYSFMVHFELFFITTAIVLTVVPLSLNSPALISNTSPCTSFSQLRKSIHFFSEANFQCWLVIAASVPPSSNRSYISLTCSIS